MLKEKEIEKYGEYRTQRLVLFYYQAWRDGDMDEFDRWLSPRMKSRGAELGEEVEDKYTRADGAALTP